MSADPAGGPVSRSDDDVRRRLAVIEDRLQQIATQLGAIGELSSRLEEINANVETVLGFIAPNRKRVGR